MGRCWGCGREDAGYVGGYLCYNCKAKAEQQKAGEFKKKYGSDVNGSSSYRPHAGTRTYRGGGGVIAPFFVVVVLAGAFLGVRSLMFNSTEKKLAESFEITTPIDGSGSDFVDEILNRDNSYMAWSMKITEYPTDYWKTIFKLSQKSAYIKCCSQDGETYWRFNFEDADAGTGLKGLYYLAEVNGTQCIVDYDNEILYPEGSEFYTEHYDALCALEYDVIMPKLTEGLTGGEYGSEKNDKKVVLIGDKVSASVYDDGYYKTRILDERGEVRVQYELNYYEKGVEKQPDFTGYSIAE